MNGVKLDVIDQKILAVLLKNARISTTELAKVIGNNYPTVYSHLTNLIQKGIILYFYPMVQVPGIGVRQTRGVYIKLKNIAPEHKGDLIKKIINNSYILQVLELEGEWDVFILMGTNKLRQYRDNLDNIKKVWSNHITNFIIMTPLFMCYLNRQFFLDENIILELDKVRTGYRKYIENRKWKSLSYHVDLDKKDMEILNFLKLNATASLEEIGKATYIDPALVDYRIKKYIKSSLIGNFGTEIDYAKLGYSQYILFLNLMGNSLARDTLVEYLKTMKNAYYYFEYVGYWELVITFCVKTREEMENIKIEISKKFQDSIKDSVVVWVKKRYKIIHYPDVELVYPPKGNPV